MTYDEFEATVSKSFFDDGDIRYGQHYFNVLHAIRPLIANKIRGTLQDPFFKHLVSEETREVVRQAW